MAESDYRSWVEVLPDFAQFNGAVQNAVVGGMATAGTDGSAAMGGSLIAGIGKFAGPLIAAFAALGIAGMITDAVRTGIDASVDYIKSSVSIASDVSESVNAVTVAYGENSKAVLQLGDDSASAFGLSRGALNEFAVRFSAFSQRIAGEGGDVAGTLESIVARGTDFASVYNIEVAEALQLFQSGLSGETEPLRRYGIDLSAATVAAYAYANGIAEQGKQLTDAQRVQAAYGALMEQTAVTQGDFANTSDELANSQRILNAELENIQAEFGEALLPVLTEVMAFVKDELLPIWADLNAEVGPELAAAFEEAWPYLKELILTLLPLIPPAIDAVVTSVQTAGDTFRTWLTFTNLIFGTLSDLFGLLTGDTSAADFAENFQARIDEWLGSFNAQMETGAQIVVGFGVTLVDQVGKIGANLFNSGRALIQRLIDGVQSMVGEVSNAFGSIMDRIAGFFPHSPAKYGAFSGAGWQSVKDAGAAIVDQFRGGLEPIDVPFLASPMGALSLSVSREASSASAGFPSQVTLVDASGALLGLMDVRIGDADSATAAEVTGGRRAW